MAPSFRPYSTTALELSTRPRDVGIKAIDVYFPKVRFFVFSAPLT